MKSDIVIDGSEITFGDFCFGGAFEEFLNRGFHGFFNRDDLSDDPGNGINLSAIEHFRIFFCVSKKDRDVFSCRSRRGELNREVKRGVVLGKAGGVVFLEVKDTGCRFSG